MSPGQDMAAWANRSGGKTLSASILAALDFMRYDNVRACVLSGSEEQARNLYQYWLRWTELPMLKERLEGSPGRLLTNVAGGRLEILAASQKRVRGPKIQRLFRDEVDETDSEVLDASVGMLSSSDAMKARIIDTSTWHRADGPMSTLVENAQAKGIALHKWGIWESLEKCSARRHQHGRGCDVCPLEPVCRAKARQLRGPDAKVGIARECVGLFRIDDAIKNFRRWSAARWQAEAECRRPSVEGRVFPEFDEGRHRCDQPPPDVKIYRAIDWGHGVFVCLWIARDKDGVSYVLDTYASEQATIHQHAQYIAAHPLSRGVADTYCDPAGRNRNDQSGQSNIEVFRKEYGIECTYNTASTAREVRNGIALIKAALDPADGRPRLFYTRGGGNAYFVKAMQRYHNRRVNGIWLDEPADPQEHEHIPDALRYYFVNVDLCRSIGVIRLGAS
ncbi:MAG: hypothetical protein ABFD92_09245 [Planctomycetaceae bacterium]|nr:hypothetical protein [Planctomycetaceae bacterium]